MDWSKGFSASCYVTEVDPTTWRDVNKMDITGGQITRNTNTLRESAQIECVDYDQSAERWVRIWMDARQEGDAAHVPLFTFYRPRGLSGSRH